MFSLSVAGIGGEVRQLAQGEVDLDHPAAGLPVLDVVDEIIGQFVAGNLIQECGTGMQCGHHQRGVDLVAVVECDALNAAVAHQHL